METFFALLTLNDVLEVFHGSLVHSTLNKSVIGGSDVNNSHKISTSKGSQNHRISPMMFTKTLKHPACLHILQYCLFDSFNALNAALC